MGNITKYDNSCKEFVELLEIEKKTKEILKGYKPIHEQNTMEDIVYIPSMGTQFSIEENELISILNCETCPSGLSLNTIHEANSTVFVKNTPFVHEFNDSYKVVLPTQYGDVEMWIEKTKNKQVDIAIKTFKDKHGGTKYLRSKTDLLQIPVDIQGIDFMDFLNPNQ